MKSTVIIGALALATSVTAVAYAQKVNTDSDPTAPFSSDRTYMWTAGTPSPNPLGEQHIHATVDQRYPSGAGAAND